MWSRSMVGACAVGMWVVPPGCVVSKARAEPSSVVFVCRGVGGVCCWAALSRGAVLVVCAGFAWCGLFFRWSWGGSDEGFRWLGVGRCALCVVVGRAEAGVWCLGLAQ